MILEYIVYASIGRLIIFFLQKFPFQKVIFLDKLFEDGKFLSDLFSCELCLGVWVYTILAYIMQIDVMKGWFDYIPIVNEIITGAVTSFVVHLIVVGWRTEYTETVITME